MWITTGEASRRTGYSQSHMRRLARERWVRVRRRGRFWIFDWEILRARRDGWITTREAKALTRYSEAHLRWLAREGLVRARKVGRYWLLNRQDLLEYSRAHGYGP